MLIHDELIKSPFLGFLGKPGKKKGNLCSGRLEQHRGDSGVDFSKIIDLVTISSYLFLSRRRFSSSRHRSVKIAREIHLADGFGKLAGHKLMYGNTMSKKGL